MGWRRPVQVFVFFRTVASFSNSSSKAAVFTRRLGCLTLSLPRPVQFPGRQIHGRTCEQYISRSFNTFTFSAMCFGEFSQASAKKKTKRLKVSDFVLYLSFSSDIVAVKGLNAEKRVCNLNHVSAGPTIVFTLHTYQRFQRRHRVDDKRE